MSADPSGHPGLAWFPDWSVPLTLGVPSSPTKQLGSLPNHLARFPESPYSFGPSGSLPQSPGLWDLRAGCYARAGRRVNRPSTWTNAPPPSRRSAWQAFADVICRTTPARSSDKTHAEYLDRRLDLERFGMFALRVT